MVRQFALRVASTLVLLGALGLMPALTATNGLLFGVLPVSPLLCAVYLALGLLGLLASRYYRDSASFARTLTVVFGVLAVLAVLPVTTTMPDLAPLTHDPLWVPGIIAAVSAYFGWGAPSREYITLL